MKKLTVLFLLFITSFLLVNGQVNIPQNISQSHPRLLLFDSDLQDIRTNIKNDKYWKKIHEDILGEADAIISLETLERKQIGRRLLSVSREALRRTYFLSYAFRMTDEKKYFNRAEAELLKIAQFTDWNPTHFLDVAEMTMAAAIGYDWLFSDLSTNAKAIIREAILKKGIEPSYDEKYNWFLKASHNWNQVCNAGMTFGALAVYEDAPELAQKTIKRAVETIKLPMKDYQPSGAYPEGDSYWTYGTSFNVLFLNAIEKNYGTDFGLTNTPGFLATAEYKQHLGGPSDYVFNYSDAGHLRKKRFEPTLFWFAAKAKNPSLIYGQNEFVEHKTYRLSDRIFPSVMIWGKGLSFENAPPPSRLFWQGEGKNPVAMMRTSWTDPNAIFVGLKGGSPSVNHGHMDVGSFVMDANGERWAMDLGMQNYESLESKGIGLWNKKQDGERWEILRYNNRYHNTLTFDNEFQLVGGKSEIIQQTDRKNFMSAVTDMTPVYANKVKTAKRGVALVDKEVVVIKDEIETSENPTKMQWTMVTPAEAEITGKNQITLTQNGKSVALMVISKQEVKLKTWSAAPVHSYDAENEGIIRVGFEVDLEANKAYDFTVMLVPNSSKRKVKVKKIADWK